MSSTYGFFFSPSNSNESSSSDEICLRLSISASIPITDSDAWHLSIYLSSILSLSPHDLSSACFTASSYVSSSDLIASLDASSNPSAANDMLSSSSWRLFIFSNEAERLLSESSAFTRKRTYFFLLAAVSARQ